MDEELIEEGPTFLTQFFWFFTPEEVYTIVDSEGRESTVVDIDIGGAKRRFLPDKKTGAIAYYYMHPEAEGLRTSGKMYQLGKVSVGTFTPVVINEETGELSEMPSYFLETPDIERLENQYPEEVVDPSMSGALVSTPLKFQAKVQIQRTTLTTQSKVFKSLTVGMMSPDEIRQISVLEVTNHNTLTTTKSPTPVANGPVDGRLGAGDHSNVCLTCDLKRDNNPENDCTGHFGHLELPIPVPHPLFAISSNPNSLQDAFNMFCHNCGKVPISDVVKERLLPQVDRTFERSRNDSGLRRIKNRTKAAMTDAKVVNSATGTMDCPHCEEKSPLLDWDRTKMMFLLRPFKKGLGGNTYYDYSTAHLLLQQIPDEDARLMGFDAPMMRPEYMFIEALPIAPNTMRPMGKDFNTGQPIENDLTLMYQQAIWRARKYREDEMSGYDPGLMTTQRAKELFVSVAHCIYNQDKKIGSFGSKSVRTKSGSEKNTIKSGILDEIVGVGRKKSSFRRRINSKTVNNVVRSVITPSGGLSINEVGVPKVSCLGTFVRVTVTEENIEHLRELVIKGVPENMGQDPTYQERHIG